LLIACEPKEEVSIIPAIHFIGFQATDSILNESYVTQDPTTGSLMTVDDTVILRIGFQDGDGDLGNQEGDTENNIIWIDSITQAVTDSGAPGATIAYGNIFITDSRSGLTFYREMDDIFAGTNNAISGEIQLRMNQYFCSAFASDQDTIIYTVFIKDRANHVSNMITLDTLFLQCQ
jgi:hypothetical protein